MVRLLCVGDIHLGRVPSRLPESLQTDCSPRAAWLSAVDEALKREVDAVVLAGDVVDSDNHFFEAYGPLAEGARKLVDAGIRLLGVAGNHDVEVLPRLAREVPGFTLLGAGGVWASEVVSSQKDDGASVRLRGWSFPQRIVESDPLDSFPRGEVDDGLPWLGVLHTQLDAPGTPYAPVASSRLRSLGAEAWLLGHVHSPSLNEESRVGYLGNLTPLDPTETGVRGPWLVEVGKASRVKLTHLPLAPLRWERVDVPVDAPDRADDVESLVTRTLREHRARLGSALGAARALGCRLRFVGRTTNVAEVRRQVAGLHFGTLSFTADGVLVFVDKKVEFLAREAWDLESLSQGSSPPGLIARRVLQLERGGAESLSLIASARERMSQVAGRRQFHSLNPWTPTDDDIRNRLIAQAHRLLEELLDQDRNRTGKENA